MSLHQTLQNVRRVIYFFEGNSRREVRAELVETVYSFWWRFRRQEVLLDYSKVYLKFLTIDVRFVTLFFNLPQVCSKFSNCLVCSKLVCGKGFTKKSCVWKFKKIMQLLHCKHLRQLNNTILFGRCKSVSW